MHVTLCACTTCVAAAVVLLLLQTLTTTNIHVHLAFILHNSDRLALAFPVSCSNRHMFLVRTAIKQQP